MNVKLSKLLVALLAGMSLLAVNVSIAQSPPGGGASGGGATGGGQKQSGPGASGGSGPSAGGSGPSAGG